MAEFEDRIDAGRQLGRRLQGLRGADVVVLGLPRGGVPVAYEVAEALGAPLDVIGVRKLGVPVHPELAMGAIGEEGARLLDERIRDHFLVTEAQLAAVERQERVVLEERTARFREGRARVDLTGRTAVIVDDGTATGATARVACRIARHLGAAKVVLAAPVAAQQAVAQISEADEVVVLAIPPEFEAVGFHYQDFTPTRDEQVVALLDAVRHHQQLQAGAGTGPAPTAVVAQDVQIPAGGRVLQGHLHLPAVNAPVVILADDNGSGRHSPGHQHVAAVLQQAGLGTVVLDLLTPEKAADWASVSDIPVLAQRFTAAMAWVHQQPHSMSSAVGYFGADTGAGAALWAAAEADARVGAVVAHSGRPGLAGERLTAVRAPTLLMVGEQATEVLELTRRAQAQLRCENRLVVVEGAGHAFEEPGTAEVAAALTRDWFTQHLDPTGDASREVAR